MTLSPRGKFGHASQSEIRNMTLECARVGGINLAQGVCDTPVPEVVRHAATRAIDQGRNSYTRYDGVSELRSAIAGDLERRSGLVYDPETEIVVTNGATGAFAITCGALLAPGDEVILFEPYYGYHLLTLRAFGLTARAVPLTAPSWTLDPLALKQAVTANTRAIVVNTPGNPSGKVFSEDELTTIAGIAADHDLLLITDEIYEHFLFDGRRHTSPAALPGLRERTVTIGGFSKTFAVTGWRIGFAACPRELALPLGTVNDLLYVCAPGPLQLGVAAGLRQLDDDFYAALRGEYSAKRDRICDALAAAGLVPFVPQGAYYVLADVQSIQGDTSKARALRILERTKVASVPGSAFFSGDRGETMTRFCFAKQDAELDEACRRLATLRARP
jgi:aminotransferase